MNARRMSVLYLIASLVAAALLLGMGGQDRSSGQGPTNPDPAVSEEGGLPSAPVEAEQEPLSAQAPNATTYYYHVRGADLYVVDGATTTTYVTGGCTYRSAGGTGLSFPVLVPPGSILKGIRVFYVDNDPAKNLTVYLVQYDDGGNVVNLATATSSGASAAVRYMDSPQITQPVNLYSYAYTLVFQPGVNSNLNQLCGIKVNYEGSIATTMLPVVAR